MRPRRTGHEALRAGTREAHERLDALFGGFDLTNRTHYAAFLSAHAQALLPIEAALDAVGAERGAADWPARKRGAMIAADLDLLGQALPATPPFRLADDETAVAGTLYVIEGSRLGGRFLARQVADGLPTSYLDPGQEAGSWAILLDRIDALLYDDDQRMRAVAAALDAFSAFEFAGRHWLSRI